MWLPLHHLTVFLVFVVSLDQLQLVDSVTFTNIGIKLCQHKCVEYGCHRIRYTSETLTCHLLDTDTDTDTDQFMEESGHFVGPLQLSKVKAGLCTLDTCPGMRCLETQGGKTVCVKDKRHQKHYRVLANTTLIDACRQGDLQQVQYILSHEPASINLRGHSDRTPAMIAAAAGHRPLLELLVEKGANLSLADDEDNNILHIACMEGNLEIVKYIHSQKIIDIDCRGGNGTTPLMLAAMFDKKDVFLFLMENKGNILKEEEDGKNILHLSCQGGNVDIVKYVLTHNVLYINSTDNNGITPLMLAAGYGNKVVFDFLIEKGADILAKDSTNRNVLHWACQGGHVKIVNDILTQHIIDINSNDGKKMTPLLTAAYHGKREVLGLLIEKGANTSAMNEDSRNSLHLSCTRGHVDTVKYVLDQTSVGINSKDCREMTPIMLAASHGKNEVFDILIKKGADLYIADGESRNILHWACSGGNVQIVNYILIQNTLDINGEDEAKMTPVMHAASEGKNEVFDILMKKGADLSVTDCDGYNILHWACSGGNVQIVNYILIQNTLDINGEDDDKMTPVMHAASEGRKEVFDILMKKGADLSVTDRDGCNILHWACRGGNAKIVNYILMQSTLDINSKTSKGETPLMLAASHRRNEVFDILMKKGADVSVTDEKGHNVLFGACQGGHVKIVNQILLQTTLDINSKVSGEMTPVMLAAYHGKNDIFDILMKKGADLSGIEKFGNNILHLACEGGNVKIVNDILMHSTLDINSKNNIKATPVMLAALHGKSEIFDILMKKGADLSVIDGRGENILHAACRGGNLKIVKYILMRNLVDINSKNSHGKTPVMFVYCHKREMVGILVKAGADLSGLEEESDNISRFHCM